MEKMTRARLHSQPLFIGYGDKWGRFMSVRYCFQCAPKGGQCLSKTGLCPGKPIHVSRAVHSPRTPDLRWVGYAYRAVDEHHISPFATPIISFVSRSHPLPSVAVTQHRTLSAVWPCPFCCEPTEPEPEIETGCVFRFIFIYQERFERKLTCPCSPLGLDQEYHHKDK